MRIHFKRMTLIDFKDHQDTTINFGDVTQASGKNGSGKTSIGEAVTWLLYSMDLEGASKFDPTPTNKEVDKVSVELLLEVNDQDLLLKRELVNGTAKYYINEVPEKATKFNDLVKEIFQSKELFLSIFNPVFFCSQKWEEQRKQLLKYVTEPTNKEILSTMTKVCQDNLEPLLKKYSLDDLEKIHRDIFNKKDKESIAVNARVKDLQEQLMEAEKKSADINVQDLNDQIKKKRAIINNYQSLLDEHNKAQKQKDSLLSEFKQRENRFTSDLETYKKLSAQTISDTCDHCGNPLNENQQIELIGKHEQEAAERKAQLIKQKDEALKIKEQYESYVVPPAPQNPAEVSEEINALIQKQYLVEDTIKLFDHLEKAKADAEKVRKERNNSLSIVDAIKIFRAKRAELMAAKLKEVFSSLDIRLTTIQKNGEEKIDFVVEHGGVDYRDLSKAEQIRAGLEISDVFMRQADLIIPVFVDNSESIDEDGFIQPLGQLIMARVANEPFGIQIKNFEKVSEVNE
ncbi:MAG TPA: ATPase [Bacillota bacterium]|nr:ATPase [Bacillota bacterium]